MTQTVKSPARLELGDMPRDKARVLGTLRQVICASFNYSRKYPPKMALLKETLRYAHNRVVQWEKEADAQFEAYAKNKLELKGKEAGINLDSRKSIENMTKDLEAFVKAAEKTESEAIALAAEEAIAAEIDAAKALLAMHQPQHQPETQPKTETTPETQPKLVKEPN